MRVCPEPSFFSRPLERDTQYKSDSPPREYACRSCRHSVHYGTVSSPTCFPAPGSTAQKGGGCIKKLKTSVGNLRRMLRRLTGGAGGGPPPDILSTLWAGGRSVHINIAPMYDLLLHPSRHVDSPLYHSPCESGSTWRTSHTGSAQVGRLHDPVALRRLFPPRSSRCGPGHHRSWPTPVSFPSLPVPDTGDLGR